MKNLINLSAFLMLFSLSSFAQDTNGEGEGTWFMDEFTVVLNVPVHCANKIPDFTLETIVEGSSDQSSVINENSHGIKIPMVNWSGTPGWPTTGEIQINAWVNGVSHSFGYYNSNGWIATLKCGVCCDCEAFCVTVAIFPESGIIEVSFTPDSGSACDGTGCGPDPQ